MAGSKMKIVTDSSCDLSKPEIEGLGATVVPLSVAFGPEVFYDGELSHDEFWEKAKGPFWPQSSQPSVGAFEQAFAPPADGGCQVLCLTITSHHSGTYNSASAAAQRFGDKVTVVDSLSVSAGLAWQVIAAVEAARQGRGVEDIVSLTQDMSRRTLLLAVLDTIENVRRGGRVAKVMPVLGRLMHVFNIKLLLKMVDGELDLLGTSRSYDKGLKRIKEEVIALMPVEKMAVVHARVPVKAAAFADVLADITRFPRGEIRVVEMGPAICTHAGPGVIGTFVLSNALPASAKA